MKAKQKQAIEAYKTLTKYGKTKFPKNETALKLFRVRKALADAWEFQIEQENAIMSACAAHTDQRGDVVFSDNEEENRAKMIVMMNDLRNTEIDLDYEPIDIPLDDIPDIVMDDIEALDGFVKFS